MIAPCVFAIPLLAALLAPEPASFVVPGVGEPAVPRLVEAGVAAPALLAETPAAWPAEAGDAASDKQYAEGARAIHESRWADAESLFANLAGEHGTHAEGALYWKAYAQNKQGHTAPALASCNELRRAYPASHWIDECTALEIEIQGNDPHAAASANPPAGPGRPPEKERDSSLLALNEMMRSNEAKALKQIESILTGSQSDSYKQHALFVLAQSASPAARELLSRVAEGRFPPGVDAALQTRARALLAPMSHRVGFDVVVTDAAGKTVVNLDAGDFTITDNGSPQTIRSFHAAGAAPANAAAKPDPPAEIIYVVDTVNTPETDISYARQQLADMLRRNDGQLANPVSVRVFNLDGAKPVAPPSQDGNPLAKALDAASPTLHPIHRSAAFYGAVERLQLSAGALGTLLAELGHQPGRKIVIWLSPGWPLLQFTDSWTSRSAGQKIFDEIVALSTAMRQARVALYTVDPDRTPGEDIARWYRYEDYLKGVRDAKHAQPGHLALQVLSTQSGGRVLNYSNDYLAGELASLLPDAAPDYFVSWDAGPAASRDEYHEVHITVNKPGLTVHTRASYYNQP